MIACAWTVALTTFTAFAVLVGIDPDTARAAAVPFLVLVLASWGYLFHHHDRRAREPRRHH